MRRILPVLCLVLAACSSLVDTEKAVHSQAGFTVQKEQSKGKGGTLLRLRGASWLRGGDATAAFQREAAALAESLGCADYRIEGRQESQEQTLFGNRRVVQGTVVCNR